MTLQELFDKSIAGIRSQQYQLAMSHDMTGACRYRTDAGLRCAVGHLIPDNLYDSTMEGVPIRELLNRYDLHGTLPTNKKAVQLMMHLQHIHDNLSGYYTSRMVSDPKNYFESHWKSAATMFELEYKEPE